MLGKILFLAVAVWLVLVLLKHYRRSMDHPAPTPKQAQDMVRCQVCGVHLPKTEGIQKNGSYYCCQEHANN